MINVFRAGQKLSHVIEESVGDLAMVVMGELCLDLSKESRDWVRAGM